MHIHFQRIRIDSKTVRNQCTDYKCQKEYKEENSIIQYCTTAFIGQFLIRYTINEIERTQHTCQKEYSQSENNIPDISQRVQSVPSISPMTDNRHNRIRHIRLIDIEIRTGEESSDCSTQQQRSHYPINYQESLIGLFTQQIPCLALELVTHSLQHKTEKNNHPKPVSPTETGTVKQRERSKESTSKRYQRSKRKFPLTPGRVHHHLTMFLRLTQTEQQRISSLHK